MAWPASTKAGTTNVDAGSDSPTNARADIKQNIDNVNSIIDEFDIASPNNGDQLTYNSTSGAWEPSAPSGGTQIAQFSIQSGAGENVSGNIYRREVGGEFDPSSILTLSTYQFTLGAGTYIIEPAGINSADDGEVTITLYNETDASTDATFTNGEIGTTGTTLLRGIHTTTLAGTKNFSLRQDAVSAADRNSTPTFRITKL